MQVQEAYPLRDLSTFKIGGAARYFVEVRSFEEAREALSWAIEKKLPFYVLGKGSNSLFHDQGFNGLVIANRIDFVRDLGNGRYVVGAGTSFARLGVLTARNSWAGLEFAAGIPASVGGAVFMNAGANGQEVKDHLEEVVFLRSDGELLDLKAHELHFSYRQSSFQQKSGMILSATFQLEKDAGARQRQLEIIRYRQRTQPYGQASIGCVFRNPEAGPAGKWIEQSGLKGEREGEAEVSPLHANFIINQGQAKAADVLALIQKVQDQVRESHGVDLEPEIRLVPHEGE